MTEPSLIIIVMKRTYMATKATMKPVLQFSITGRLIAVYDSITDAAKKTGISYSTILRALKKRSGLKKGKGYIWYYKDDFDRDRLREIIKECL